MGFRGMILERHDTRQSQSAHLTKWMLAGHFIPLGILRKIRALNVVPRLISFAVLERSLGVRLELITEIESALNRPIYH